ncbi:MAG: phosphopantetheine-binding protein [Microcoleus sp.]
MEYAVYYVSLRGTKQSQSTSELPGIWENMFRVSPVSRDDDLFDIGGDSLSVVSFFEKLKQEFRVDIPLSHFVNESSLASLSRLFDKYKQEKPSLIVEVCLSDFEIVPFEEQYLEETVELVSESFTSREPLGVSLGIQKEEFNIFSEKICINCLCDSLSFLALHRLSRNVIGFCLCEDFASSLAGEFEIPEFLNPIFALLDSLDQMYLKSYGAVKVGEIVHVFMSGTSSDVEGTAIVLALEKKVLEVAASLNYKRAVTTCSHSVTSYIAQELGYQRRYAVQYESFEFENKRVFSNVVDPHKEAVLFEKVLEKQSFH